uniref:Uncharacterized protein n=1 Tax=Timema bartmani TaxID=61472 RepID=A0A7R9EPH8_9NEOP|nr:unnamed protein product [Timema bartmani]
MDFIDGKIHKVLKRGRNIVEGVKNEIKESSLTHHDLFVSSQGGSMKRKYPFHGTQFKKRKLDSNTKTKQFNNDRSNKQHFRGQKTDLSKNKSSLNKQFGRQKTNFPKSKSSSKMNTSKKVFPLLRSCITRFTLAPDEFRLEETSVKELAGNNRFSSRVTLPLSLSSCSNVKFELCSSFHCVCSLFYVSLHLFLYFLPNIDGLLVTIDLENNEEMKVIQC